MSIDFSVMRDSLRSIGVAVGDGYLVSCSWDGEFLRAAIGRVASEGRPWRKPWVMTFDNEADYSEDAAAFVSRFAHEAKVWFESTQEDADEIERRSKAAQSK